MDLTKLLLTCLLIPALCLSVKAQSNPKPFVIPELQEWSGAQGNFTPGKSFSLFIPSDHNEQIKKVAAIFANDYQTMFGKKLKVKTGTPQPGNLSFSLTNTPDLGTEGYTIKIEEEGVKVSANTPTGLFWATRTLLQMAEQSADRSLPKGYIKDYPEYPQRGFMLDCGRKFFSLDFLRDYVKLMAYYKMNIFQIHLNDNGFKQYFNHDWNKTYSAFRLESDYFPGLTAKDGSYSKKEFIDLQKLAEDYQVLIIPEIDAPAHSLAFTKYIPEIGSQKYGMDHLDLFHPRTYTFMDSLFTEYLSGPEPVFRGKYVHIGTDEYSNQNKEVVEKFRYFTDHYIRFVEKFGKQAYVWGALTHANGQTPVKSENVTMNLWYNGYANPQEMIKQGYKLLSIPDGLVYIVPIAGYYYDYLNTQHLYEKWTPAQIGNVRFEENHPSIVGGMFAVWNDHAGNGITAQDVHHRAFPAMQTIAVKTWTGKNVRLPYTEFNRQRLLLSEAPGVNVAGRIGKEKQLVYEKKKLSAGKKLPFPEIGYDYTIEFDILNQEEAEGIILTQSPHATFYLTTPGSGRLGFSREGYTNTFNYKLPLNEKVHITITGDAVSTKLYVNGQLKENLDIQHLTYNNGKDKMNYIRTLVFPLERTGNFKSRITDFKCYNYIK